MTLYSIALHGVRRETEQNGRQLPAHLTSIYVPAKYFAYELAHKVGTDTNWFYEHSSMRIKCGLDEYGAIKTDIPMLVYLNISTDAAWRTIDHVSHHYLPQTNFLRVLNKIAKLMKKKFPQISRNTNPNMEL